MPPAAAKVLVTGSSGFVGSHLVRVLVAQGRAVRCAVRTPGATPPAGAESVTALEVGPATDWSRLLEGVALVFHLANRAHVLRETARDPDAEYERVNAEGTARLARAARAAGVRRLVYVSSIGVHGDRSGAGAITESSPIAPRNAYARSKAHAEAALRAEAGSALEFAIVRPPLIYGAGVPGNFRRLLGAIGAGVPLPFASVRNRRSLAAVGNVVDLLLACGDSALAAGEAWVVADDEDFSTPELIRTLAAGLGRPARLLPCPVPLLRAAARIAGLRQPFQQLCGTLQVDASRARAQLGWTPRHAAQSALMDTARWFARSRSSS